MGPPFDETEKQALAELKLTDRIEHYGQVSDSHLAKLYHCSIALVYPSHYEGFGIPPIEAMSCGTAVIASNASCIPEVVGDAGLLFNPSSTDELVDIMLLLVDKPNERDRLVKMGCQRAQAFSWDKTAASTVDIYRSLSR